MLLRKKDADKRALAQKTPGAVERQPDAEPISVGLKSRTTADADAQTSLVLDALGGVIAALARFPVDRPHRPAAETTEKSPRGNAMPHSGRPSAVPTMATPSALSIAAGRASCAPSRHCSAMSRIPSTRWCLSCARRSGPACPLCTKRYAEARTRTHLALMKKAVSGSQLTKIKDDLLNAVSEIDRTLK